MATKRKWLKFVTAAIAAGGLLPGCLAAVQGSLDAVLSPGAFGHALILPFTGLVGLASLFAAFQ